MYCVLCSLLCPVKMLLISLSFRLLTANTKYTKLENMQKMVTTNLNCLVYNTQTHSSKPFHNAGLLAFLKYLNRLHVISCQLFHTKNPYFFIPLLPSYIIINIQEMLKVNSFLKEKCTVVTVTPLFIVYVMLNK